MAYQIEVKQIKPFPVAEFDVKVSGKSQTTHIVSLEENYIKKLTECKITAEKLVYLSFEFLLDREPNTSILKRFNLREIKRIKQRKSMLNQYSHRQQLLKRFLYKP